jgi:hypothetical protein
MVELGGSHRVSTSHASCWTLKSVEIMNFRSGTIYPYPDNQECHISRRIDIDMGVLIDIDQAAQQANLLVAILLEEMAARDAPFELLNLVQLHPSTSIRVLSLFVSQDDEEFLA